MSSCVVHLDNFNGQYYPGNQIIGRVVCSFTKAKSARGVKLRLRGMEHNDWTEEESYYNEQEKRTEYQTVTYSGDNKFFAVETTLSSEGDYPPGQHEYPFSFNLPRNLPGTFHGQYGWIKYQIKAIVDIPWGSDYEYRKEFNLVAPIDFNEIQGSLQLQPTAYSDDKMVCCCCCASGPVTMNLYMEKEAFVQGETAKLRVEITNLANDNVEGLEVKLGTVIESTTTTPSTHSKTDYELIAAAHESGVGAHGERTYDINLHIPKSTVVPNFNLCTLFKQWTDLNVTALMGSCTENLSIATLITMGHIPIGGQEQMQNMTLQQSTYPGGSYPPPVSPAYPAGDAAYPQAAAPYPPGNYPPSYTPAYPPAGAPSYPPTNGSPYAPAAPAASSYPPGPPAVSLGFAMPGAPPSTDTKFPSFPPGGVPVGPVSQGTPYPTGPGATMAPGGYLGASSATAPNAPPHESSASAPSKAQMAEGEFVVVGEGSSLLPGGQPGHHTGELPPPSYHDALKNPTAPYPPK